MSDSLGAQHSLSSDDPDERGENARMPFGRALGLTVLGAIVPGFGLIGAGRRKAGLTVLSSSWRWPPRRATSPSPSGAPLTHWAVQPEALLVISLGLPALAAAWVGVIVATYRSLRPDRTAVWKRLVGYGLVASMAS